MKLYFSPGACSLAPHICLREAGLSFDLEGVDLGTKKTKSGADFTKINPKGYVPTLALDDGKILTEGVVIMSYVGDQKPESGLVPKPGFDRYRYLEMMMFISTELHKGYSPLFNAKLPDVAKDMARETLTARRLPIINEALKASGQFLMGKTFMAPDAYLFTVLSWSNYTKVDLTKFPAIMGFMERVGSRPSVRAAHEAEGLKK